MQPHTQLNEKLDWIVRGENLAEKIKRARTIMEKDVTFLPFMKMAVTASEKLEGLPPGMPDTYKPETDIPDGVSDTSARQEFRRIKNFLPTGSMASLPPHRRETIWIQLIEGMHWKEANVMVHIKDQTLLELYPDLRDVLPELGVEVAVAAPKSAKKPAKKSSKNNSKNSVSTENRV